MSPVELKDPVPSGYSQAVRQRLQEYLTGAFRAAALPKGSAVVSFVLGHDGNVLGDFQVSSPQGPPFIAAAKTALVQAQPFPPFPAGAQASEVQFKMAVEYAPGQ
jgi:outer membrane biosynthesis protein TonB